MIHGDYISIIYITNDKTKNNINTGTNKISQ